MAALKSVKVNKGVLAVALQVATKRVQEFDSSVLKRTKKKAIEPVVTAQCVPFCPVEHC